MWLHGQIARLNTEVIVAQMADVHCPFIQSPWKYHETEQVNSQTFPFPTQRTLEIYHPISAFFGRPAPELKLTQSQLTVCGFMDRWHDWIQKVLWHRWLMSIVPLSKVPENITKVNRWTFKLFHFPLKGHLKFITPHFLVVRLQLTLVIRWKTWWEVSQWHRDSELLKSFHLDIQDGLFRLRSLIRAFAA